MKNKESVDCLCIQCTYESPKSVEEIYTLAVQSMWENDFDKLDLPTKIKFLEAIKRRSGVYIR